MVLLVTDGQSNSRDLTIREAQALKGNGVEIYVVAVGSHINGIDEMVKVASSPPENHMFRVQTLSGFGGSSNWLSYKSTPENTPS